MFVQPGSLSAYTHQNNQPNAQNSKNTQPPKSYDLRKRTIAPSPTPTQDRTSAKSLSLHAPYESLRPVDDDDTKMDTTVDDTVAHVPSNGLGNLQEALVHCVYCHDIGSFIWTCQGKECGNTVCVGKALGDHGCIDASPCEHSGKELVTQATFLCPQCYRARKMAVPYKVQGYAVRQEFMFRNYFPLLAIFLSWSGFGRQFTPDIVLRTLQEHFHHVRSRLFTASRTIKKGNNRPYLLNEAFNWFERINHCGNMLIFVNTHSDSETGQLVVSGGAKDPRSVPVWELLDGYLGSNFTTASQRMQINNATEGIGPFIRGLVLCSCGATGRVRKSVENLSRLVERNIFDFVLCFAGVSTVDSIVTPAITRFIENVFVYDMEIWNALEHSFGEDRHALNSSPILLSFATFEKQADATQRRTAHTRLLAYSNFRDARPWGLDIYQCHTCRAHAHNMIFHPDGHQFAGAKWLDTKMKYECLVCGSRRRLIPTPQWVHKCGAENFGRVWYRWPLSSDELKEIGVVSVEAKDEHSQ